MALPPKDTAPTSVRWSPGAWTPKRCAVWRALAEHLRAEFEAWVMDEGRGDDPACYPSQLKPEHEALLAGA